MAEYTARNGTKYTDEDIERWAAEAEAGFPGVKFGPSSAGPPTSGRPITVGEQARPFTLRLDVARRAKLDQVAQQRHLTASQLVRDLIDAL
jgi:predicted transcriptional regulator